MGTNVNICLHKNVKTYLHSANRRPDHYQKVAKSLMPHRVEYARISIDRGF